VRVLIFSQRFIIPLVIFVLCYWKIILGLRRGNKVAASQREQPVTGQSTSTAPAATSGRSKSTNKAQRNVIKTMLVVISCFIVCWLPFQFMFVAYLCGLQVSNFTTLYYAFVVRSDRFRQPVRQPVHLRYRRVPLPERSQLCCWDLSTGA